MELNKNDLTMCPRLSSTLLILLLFINSTYAMQNDSIFVAGKVVDAISQVPLVDAKIAFMLADCTIVSQGQPIDWCEKYGINDGTVLIT